MGSQPWRRDDDVVSQRQAGLGASHGSETTALTLEGVAGRARGSRRSRELARSGGARPFEVVCTVTCDERSFR